MTTDLKRVRDNWVIGLMQKGLIVKLTMSRWRGYSVLTHEDLGIKFTTDESFDFSNKYLQIGMHKLLPPVVSQRFHTIENKSRSLLQSISFITPWGSFVPEHLLPDWEKDIGALRQEYFEAVCLLGDNYTAIVEEVKNDYRGFAKDVWDRLYPENKGGATDSFVEHFVQRIADKIPPREEIVSSFKFNYVYFEIPIPSTLQENIAKADEIKMANDLAKESHQMVVDTKRRIADFYEVKREEFIDGFIESTVKSLRNHVSELCGEVLASIGRSSRTSDDLNVNNKKKIKKLIEETKKLNFYDDKKVDTMLEELNVELNKVKGEANADIIEDRLKKLSELSKIELQVEDFNPTIGFLEI